MPMSDPPVGRGPLTRGATRARRWQRLRLAEANIESLQDVLLSQESLADKLTTALQASAAVPAGAGSGAAGAGGGGPVGGVARRGAGRKTPGRATPGGESSRRPASRAGSAGRRRSQRVRPKRSHGPTFATRTWIDLYDTVDDETRRALAAQVAAIPAPEQPLISIIFPVYNSPEEFLRQAIDSVRAQLYTKWELCIADDCSTLPHVAKVLEEYAALDERILVHRRQENGHISACSNSAVALATGSWLGLMDHDDVLAEHTLAVCALALQRHPEAAIVYSDEDHIEADGSRSQPYFKPDFDPLLILGQNYFSHLSLVRADLVELVGGFREGYEGSQDWDLLLRVLEHVRPDQVVHVPHVLYHWRVHSESTASVGVGQTVCGGCLAPGGRGTPQADRRGGHGHHRLGHQLQPGRVGAPAEPAQGQRHHPAAFGPVSGPLYRQCPHAHALPGARDPAGRRRGVPSPHATDAERARRMADHPREHPGHQRLGAEELCRPAGERRCAVLLVGPRRGAQPLLAARAGGHPLPSRHRLRRRQAPLSQSPDSERGDGAGNRRDRGQSAPSVLREVRQRLCRASEAGPVPVRRQLGGHGRP